VRWYRSIFLLCIFLITGIPLGTQAQSLSGPSVMVEVNDTHPKREVLSLKVGDVWQPMLAAASAVHIRTDAGMYICTMTKGSRIEGGLLVTGDCGVGSFEQRIRLTSENDVLDVSTRLILAQDTSVRSVEDRYDFLPPVHTTTDEHTGPLDFIWSQNIKSEAGDLIPTNSFKSPAVMMQQGRLFAAILPRLTCRHVQIRALDLDVTSDQFP